ncbi:MAG: MarR family winged helix-turn-helix transcriptional regulator [Candidatus Dormibacteraceae bacterium]
MAYLQQLIAARAGLNVTDLRGVSVLAQDGPMSAGALRKRLHLTGGAATTAVDRLVSKGLALRQSDPSDRRKVIISVNPEALAGIRSTYGEIDGLFRQLLAGYDKDELTTLLRFLHDTTALTERLAAELELP